jgi:hypothetical protein
LPIGRQTLPQPIRNIHLFKGIYLNTDGDIAPFHNQFIFLPRAGSPVSPGDGGFADVKIMLQTGVVDDTRIVDIGETDLDGCAKGHTIIPPTNVDGASRLFLEPPRE